MKELNSPKKTEIPKGNTIVKKQVKRIFFFSFFIEIWFYRGQSESFDGFKREDVRK